MKKQKPENQQSNTAADHINNKNRDRVTGKTDYSNINPIDFDDIDDINDIDIDDIDSGDTFIGTINIDDTDFDTQSADYSDADDLTAEGIEADDMGVESIDIETALNDFISDEPNNPETLPEHSRSFFPYIIIGVLSVSLAALGGLTFMSLDRLASLQTRVSQLQQTVTEISTSASTLSQKAEELKALQAEEAEMAKNTENTSTSQTAEVQGPQLPAISEEITQEEGTLSPSSGNDQTFTNNTDESMDSLLTQIEPLLPQNNGTWSVYVCNLKKGTEGLIGGGKMQAASLIKLYIMGTVYENYDSLAQLHGKDNLDSYLRSMITVSDNDAANILVNWLGSGDDANGMQMVNDFCQAHGYTETSMGRLLLQSNENGDNYTSVTDCGRFLKEIYQINNGSAASSTLSHADSMYALLKQQQRTNKIPAKLPEGVHVANKTGELSNVENDAGIIYDTAQGIDLVVCFMSENLTDTTAAQASIAENARLIYGYYNE